MFNNCTSLVETPAGWYLPAEKTTTSSCNGMFYGCSKLQKMAVSYSGTITASHWSSFLYGVSSTGTFVKNSAATWTNDEAGIPSGWTVETASPDK